MDRTEKIDQVINDYRAERFAERKEEIKEYYRQTEMRSAGSLQGKYGVGSKAVRKNKRQ